MEKNEPLLSGASYFWSEALNAFLFSSRPMSPTIIDVTMDTSSTVTMLDLEVQPTHRFQTKNMSGWKGYMSSCRKTGPISDREHMAFLNI